MDRSSDRWCGALIGNRTGRNTATGLVLFLLTLGAVGVGMVAVGCQLFAPETFPFVLGTISPDSGPTSGGTVVTIYGKNFSSASAVLFGQVNAASVSVVNENILAAVTPPNPEGAVDVVIYAPGTELMTIENGFTYVDTPAPAPVPLSVALLTPSSGPTAGGTEVTILGTGFAEGVAVLFGQVSATEISVFNEEAITAITPPHEAGQVDVSVAADGQITAVTGGYIYIEFPPDDGTDSDGDGRTDVQEKTGYLITVDLLGFGMHPRNLVQYTATSDPGDPDTDDDGVNDFDEFVNKSDPRKKDTDGDGLHDHEELNRWLSSPVSVDSDGDARGPDGNLPPASILFDGQELYTTGELELAPQNRTQVKVGATSPTLDDTDGDGKTDFEEIDDPLRNSRIADLPALKLEVVDDIVVRLNVQYSDSVGVETGVSTSLSQGTTTSTSISQSDSSSTTESVENSEKIGASLTSGFPPSMTISGEISETRGFSETTGTTFTTESSESKSTQEAFASFQNQSRDRTEVAADGFVSLGVRAKNEGNFAFSLTDLIFTLRQFVSPRMPGADAEFRTLATLSLGQSAAELGENGTTLAPGQSSGILPVSAQGVSASLIREFLARPNNLILETVNLGLKNDQGMSYVFVTENTFGRTALLVIDYGDGVVERYRVATNVDRNPDSSYAGIKLGRVLEDIGIDFETVASYTGTQTLSRIRRGGVDFEIDQHEDDPSPIPPPTDGPDPPSNLKLLWIIIGARDEQVVDVAGPIDLGVDFEDIVLQNRDEVRLVFVRDLDRDGLHDREEYVFGSSDETAYSDGDTMSDYFETRVGWMAGIRWNDPCNPGDPNDPNDYEVRLDRGQQGSVDAYPRLVFSDPTTTDADRDGLDDSTEFEGGTDPFNPDTDTDGFDDNVDPFPLNPARRLYVNATVAGGAGDGSSWEDAFDSLEDALTEADATNNGDTDPNNDVGEIWVAQGEYQPAAGTSFMLYPNIKVYGGFGGGETRLVERNANPLVNNTILSGNGNRVVETSGTPGATTVLDGFAITGGDATTYPDEQGGGIKIVGSPTLRNLFITGNTADTGGGIEISGADSKPLITQCDISINNAEFDGGGVRVTAGASPTLMDCDIDRNTIEADTEMDTYGGGMYVATGSSVTLLRCHFTGNVHRNNHALLSHDAYGGALAFNGARGTMTNCTFHGNRLEASSIAGWAVFVGIGQGVSVASEVAMVNCSVWGNDVVTAQFTSCAAVQVSGVWLGDSRLAMTNCTIAGNGHSDPWAGCGVYVRSGFAELTNCIAWGNLTSGSGADQISVNTSADAAIRTTLIEDLPLEFLGNGNVAGDPLFVSWDPSTVDTPDLRVQTGSPAIDAGNNIVDVDPYEPGIQFLPEADLYGDPRIADGDDDGDAVVDMGAFEF